MTIRPGTAQDATMAARLHASSITEGFLPRLGPRFLSRLYRCIAGDAQSFLLIADSADGQPAGMIAGTQDVQALYRRFVRRDGLIAAAVAAPRVLRNARSVLETWRYGRSHGDDLPAAELLAVAVADGARGHGLGRDLVTALNAEFARRGTAATRVVVGADNTAALHLYRSCGYRDVSSIEVHERVESKVLVWSPSPH
jgi:ribosomal protein S18 acetylase RimI-like enzyme